MNQISNSTVTPSETSPLVSVIVPVYNVSNYLSTCIESLQNQSLSDIEIILVDDGSTDLSGVLADKYAEADWRCRVIHQRNQGLGYARNTGIRAARGKYIGFVDSDDWVSEDMFMALSSLAESTQADIVFSGYQIMHNGNTAREVPHPFGGTVLDNKEALRQFRPYLFGGAPEDSHCDDVPISVWCCIYRKSFIGESGILFDRARHFEDGFFNIRASRNAQKIAFSRGVFYNYRKDGQPSITKDFSEKSVSDCLDTYRDLLALAREEKDSAFSRKCELHASRTIMANCRSLIFMIEDSNLVKEDRARLIKMLLSDDSVIRALYGYPASKLPLWEAAVFYAMKYRLQLALSILSKLRNTFKKW